MFRQTSFDEFKKASENQKRAVVFQEFPCDDITPIHAFLSLDTREGAVLLESAVKDEEMGRYSLIAVEPYSSFTSPSFTDLKQVVLEHRLKANAAYPPLVGGAIGFLSYDAVRQFEEIPDRHQKGGIPEVYFLFHSVHIAFDHAKGSLLISAIVPVGADPEKEYAGALSKIAEVRAKIQAPLPKRARAAQPAEAFEEEMGDGEFCEKVKRAKEYIRKGDAFQIVLSRTFRCSYTQDPFDVYRALRMTNPSPFMFYIETKEFAIAGSSPERLVKVEQGRLQTMPIAGTRPRIQGVEDKAVLDLLQDPKEDAEHMMLVDLGRNDLGSVAQVGSVEVKELKRARYFPHVIHLVSLIEAQLKKECDALDALKAVFPAGTLTGAPKIRAMQIIDELENSRRGLYGGAICTIDNNGNLDSCIAIRTAVFQDGEASVRAGAGIVFDSEPMKEAEETRHKAKGVLKAIDLAKEGVL